MTRSGSPAAGAQSASTVPPRVDADLRLEVGDATAHLHGGGAHLILSSPDVAAFCVAVLGSLATVSGRGRRGASARAALASAASTLDRSGLSVELVGTAGPVLTLGRVHPSLVARAVTGSRHVRLGPARAVGPAAWSLTRAAAPEVLRRARRLGGRARSRDH